MSVPHDNDEPLPTGWHKAPPGTVAHIGSKLRSRRRRRSFLRAAGATAAALIVGGGGLVFRRYGLPGRENDFGGIRCSEVKRLTKAYMMGEVQEPIRSRMAEHLDRCPKCGPMFHEMKRKGDT